MADIEQSRLWRENYITTFLERDIPQLGIQIPAKTLRRFWTMLSHCHGQILNYKELNLSHLWVVYPGKIKYRLSQNITMLPLKDTCAQWEYP